MTTNVNVYVPNIGEKENLKAFLLQKAMVVGLYKTQIIPDGNTVFETLEEMLTGGGRGYARKEITNNIVETARTADKWFVSTNALGRAEGAYHNAALSWLFNSFDVADAATVYGVFAFNYVIPFDAGAKEIRVGDKIKGVTSGATGIVTGVCVTSGSWAAGTAAGVLDVMTKTGTFQDDEDITIYGRIATVAVAAGGTGYAVGDILQITQAGASGSKIVVLTVNAGAVLTVGVIEGGTGHSVAAGLATTHLTGAGNDDCTLDISTLATTKLAATNTGVTADAHKRLLAVWAFTTGVAITQIGQQVTWDHKYAMASGT